MSNMLSELIKGYIEFLYAIGRSAPTIRNYQFSLNLFLKFTGDIEARKLALDNVIEFYKYLRLKNYSKGTIFTFAVQVKTFLRWTRKSLTFNPDLIEVPPKAEHKTVYLTKEEFNKIVGSINCRKFADCRLRAMLEVYMSTGARLSGIVNLELKHIDLKRGEAVIRKKGGGRMTVYLTPRAVYWVKKYLARRDDNNPYLWVTRGKCGNLHKLNIYGIEAQVRNLRARLNIDKDWTIHSLRHSFATQILTNGANIRVVQDLLGHKNIQSTMIYTNICNKDLKEAHHRYLKI